MRHCYSTEGRIVERDLRTELVTDSFVYRWTGSLARSASGGWVYCWHLLLDLSDAVDLALTASWRVDWAARALVIM